MIFRELPIERQTLLLGATITNTMKRLREVTKNDVFLWEATAGYVNRVTGRAGASPASQQACPYRYFFLSNSEIFYIYVIFLVSPCCWI